MDIATTSTQRTIADCPWVHLGETAGEEISIFPSPYVDIAYPTLCLYLPDNVFQNKATY